jgi:hypothetical protein
VRLIERFYYKPRLDGLLERKRLRRLMLGSMAELHISEAELERDLHAVLEEVRQGARLWSRRSTSLWRS